MTEVQTWYKIDLKKAVVSTGSTTEGRCMARKEFCEKDGILITYTNDDVCFEDCRTAESILISNDGTVIHSNFEK
jgi:hypothetical protein